jgi:hypothetical protein
MLPKVEYEDYTWINVFIPSPVGHIKYRFHGYDYDVKVCYETEGEPYLNATHFEDQKRNRKIYLRPEEARFLKWKLN